MKNGSIQNILELGDTKNVDIHSHLVMSTSLKLPTQHPDIVRTSISSFAQNFGDGSTISTNQQRMPISQRCVLYGTDRWTFDGQS